MQAVKGMVAKIQRNNVLLSAGKFVVVKLRDTSASQKSKKLCGPWISLSFRAA